MEISPLLARMLEARGITDQTKIEEFLKPSLKRDWANPYDINGMEEVADAVESAVRAGKRITIYGDYDVDGITATCVMMRGLLEINKHINAGMKVDYFLPRRFDEGYGFTENSVSRLLNQKVLPEVIISVDCGITAAKEIKILQDAGIELIVTDHHAKSEDKPVNIPLIDPEADDSDTENSILAGVGVALKLIQCLGGRLGLPNLWIDLIDLATLGTLSDVMPLVGQNRALVSEGLKTINKIPRPAIRALLDVANKKYGHLTSTDIGYVLTPRLNAAGRMNNAEVAVDLLMSDDYSNAYNYAVEIESFNNQRREITDKIMKAANYRAKTIIDNNPGARSLVIASENWHPGVIGIVCSKIAETYNVPTIIMNIEDGIASGSGRSVASIDLHKACMSCFDNFIKFGGHSGACGLTLNVSDIEKFAQSLDEYMQKLDSSEFEKEYKYDLEVGLHELDINDIESLSALEPFGNQNEEPTFLTKNVFIKRAKAVGAENNHLSCYITDGAYGAQGIMFNVSDIEHYLKCDGTVFTYYHPRIESFAGKRAVKMYMQAIVSSSSSGTDDNSNSTYFDKLFASLDTHQRPNASVGDFIQTNVLFYNNDIIARISDNKNHESECSDREKYASMSRDKVQNEIIKAMIGEGGKLHASQQETLDEISQGHSVLSVMPTGRGKSLIFQVYASTIAITENKMSIFVYPLRALISDQAFHLQKNLEKFGLNICVMNGETPNEERKKNYELMRESKIDIMLTTPEFLAIHSEEISNSAKVGFVVIDEAHHLGGVKIGDRTAYGHMPLILDKLNNPQVLALSATVNDDVCTEIKKYLPVKKIVKDNYERENLYVDDRRNIKCRDDYLVSLCASGQKIVIYVNSRQQTVDLARMIKSRAPHIAMQVGFYNAGMTKEDRKKIESLFRDNKLSVLVATSAFGEGVNIPDIRHVCLYHLPFSNVEFNQMAGRCGRDNNPAIVHLLYNRADATINKQILEMSNPGHNLLAQIYRWIKISCSNFGQAIEICNEDMQKMYEAKTIPAEPGAVLCAFDIFSELGLINAETLVRDGKTYSKIAIVEMSSKVNLEDSSRFCEGQNEVNNFEDYRMTAMRRPAEQLQQMLRHPILPSEISLT